ncbi:hypothetical protein Bhyg_06715 [Pseudolycoriella hygida]|uniref:Uncharacterized protein n=1 Tax=Pseudolycoriella hygida TaxID=35572 RepID=A0A9Q0S194_9DIPT|nr:hypothetical protein Bhyg_06715 [Pseudolycoriella hygida]
MYKFMLLCMLIACALSAPTEHPSEIATKDSFVQEKSVKENSKITPLINSSSTEKRDKREDGSVSSSTAENKRTPVLSQPDYQENKPPTFVHPVPVDQIIKNSHVAPEVHAKKHLEEVNEESNVEETTDDERQHTHAFHKKTLNTKTDSETDDEKSDESH